MRTPKQMRDEQKSAVFVALLLFNSVLVLIQLWLFVSVLREGGLLGAKSPAENKAPAPSPATPHAAAAPAVASKEEGK